MASIEDFKTWLQRDLSRFGKNETHIEVVQGVSSEPVQPGQAAEQRIMKIRLYTNTNCYAITAHERTKDNGYLGCISSTRKPRAGEDWTRGSDLADGSLNETTWHKILADIVSYEMVGIHHPNKFTLPDDIESVEGPPVDSSDTEM